MGQSRAGMDEKDLSLLGDKFVLISYPFSRCELPAVSYN